DEPALPVTRVVRVLQSLRGLLGQRRRDLDGDRRSPLAAGDDRRQILSGQVFHADEVLALYFAELVDGDDVRVLEPRGDSRFVEEHLSQLSAVREVGRIRLRATILTKP